MRLRRFFAALGMGACAALLSACGNLTQSPAHDLTFTAPPGFHSQASIMGMMQVWTASSDQQMMLFRMPAIVDAQKGVDSANVNHAKILKKEPITICKGEPATFLLLTGQKKKVGSHPGRNEMVQVVMLQGKSDTMFSMYVYPTGVKPNPAAESALRNLCKRPGSTA